MKIFSKQLLVAARRSILFALSAGLAVSAGAAEPAGIRYSDFIKYGAPEYAPLTGAESFYADSFSPTLSAAPAGSSLWGSYFGVIGLAAAVAVVADKSGGATTTTAPPVLTCADGGTADARPTFSPPTAQRLSAQMALDDDPRGYDPNIVQNGVLAADDGVEGGYFFRVVRTTVTIEVKGIFLSDDAILKYDDPDTGMEESVKAGDVLGIVLNQRSSINTIPLLDSHPRFRVISKPAGGVFLSTLFIAKQEATACAPATDNFFWGFCRQSFVAR